MHHWLITHAHPKQLERYWKWLQERKYVREGPLQRGYARPMISKVELWDIRLPSDVTDAFVEDLKVSLHRDLRKKAGGSEKITLGTIPDKIIGFINWLWFSPFKSLNRFMKGYSNTPEDVNKEKLDGWIQQKYLGGSPDPIKSGKELL